MNACIDLPTIDQFKILIIICTQNQCNLYPFESDPAYWLLKPRGTFCRRDSDGDVETDGHVLVLHQPQVDRLVLRELVLLLAVDLQVVKVHVDPATVAEKACKYYRIIKRAIQEKE